jgi:hypothetical protein
VQQIEVAVRHDDDPACVGLPPPPCLKPDRVNLSRLPAVRPFSTDQTNCGRASCLRQRRE